MVASKRHKDLYWFRTKPYVQSQRRSSTCSSLECSKVLTMRGARMVKEMVESMLDEGQPEEKLQEPYCYG
jgi:uncharacterized protein with PIN domain